MNTYYNQIIDSFPSNEPSCCPENYLDEYIKIDSSTNVKCDNIDKHLYDTFNRKFEDFYSYLSANNESNYYVYLKLIKDFDVDLCANVNAYDRYLKRINDDVEPDLSVSDTSTSSEFVNQQNTDILKYFNQYTSKLVYLFHHTDFEDGIDNDLILKVKSFFKKNSYMTIIWLNCVYSEHQKDEGVVEGILRLLTYLDISEYRVFLIPIVKASFNDKNSSVQEAAIMVAEEWRTKECLDALQTCLFSSKWINEYADKVIAELKEELK